jgi:hypothetical protein
MYLFHACLIQAYAARLTIFGPPLADKSMHNVMLLERKVMRINPAQKRLVNPTFYQLHRHYSF